jgi:hypothetical protein
MPNIGRCQVPIKGGSGAYYRGQAAMIGGQVPITGGDCHTMMGSVRLKIMSMPVI